MQRVRIVSSPSFGAIGDRVAAILQARIDERCPARPTEQHEVTITLAGDQSLSAESFRIDDGRTGVRVSAPDGLGLLAGVGKLLRTGRFTADGFEPGAWRGQSTPACRLRGIYFASHFHNWYQAAPQDEIERYVEDLALWGINTIAAIYPCIDLNGFEDPEAGPSLLQLRRLFGAARRLGLRVCFLTGNTLFANTPAELLATPVNDPLGRRGNTGAPICPNNPAANALLLDCHRRLFGELADLQIDYLGVWPYDEGGCGCAACAPWGANGHLKVTRELAALARAVWPGVQVILSTWMYDTPPEGEWEGLTKALAGGNHGIDYILADSHEDFPRYPLDQGVPGGLPLLSFPEISMWGLYPWGGYGATPLPARFERLWRQAGDRLAGGLAYSEGIFEDINKAVVAGFYWNRQAAAAETLAEYVAYEYGPEAVEPVQRLVSLIEESHTRAAAKQPVEPDTVRQALDLAKQADAKMPAWARVGWRWRILYLRAVLDHERHLADLNTAEARAAMRELIDIFHARVVDDPADPYHQRVRPPLG